MLILDLMKAYLKVESRLNTWLPHVNPWLIEAIFEGGMKVCGLIWPGEHNRLVQSLNARATWRKFRFLSMPKRRASRKFQTEGKWTAYGRGNVLITYPSNGEGESIRFHYSPGNLGGFQSEMVRLLRSTILLARKGRLEAIGWRLGGDWAGSLEHLTKALEISPHDYECLRHRAYVNHLLGNVDETLNRRKKMPDLRSRSMHFRRSQQNVIGRNSCSIFGVQAGLSTVVVNFAFPLEYERFSLADSHWDYSVACLECFVCCQNCRRWHLEAGRQDLVTNRMSLIKIDDDRVRWNCSWNRESKAIKREFILSSPGLWELILCIFWAYIIYR